MITVKSKIRSHQSYPARNKILRNSAKNLDANFQNPAHIYLIIFLNYDTFMISGLFILKNLKRKNNLYNVFTFSKTAQAIKCHAYYNKMI